MIRFPIGSPNASGRYRQALATILLASSVSGCASFKEVKSFASLSSAAANYGALTKDYIGALDRRKQYQPEKFHAGLDAQKMRREAQRASLNLLQQSVTDYMQGLNGLATGDVRPYDRSLKNLSNNLNQATLLTHGEKEAVGALSTILARAVTAGYRLHAIRKLIGDGNQPLQGVINAIRKIVMKGMVADLHVESALLGRYYDNFMLAPGNPVEPVAMTLAKEARTEALGRVNSRIQSARSYDDILEKIAQGHQYMYDHREMAGHKEFDLQLKPYVDELRAAYRNLLDGSP